MGSNYSNKTRSFGLNNLSREHLIIAVIPLPSELESLGVGVEAEIADWQSLLGSATSGFASAQILEPP